MIASGQVMVTWGADGRQEIKTTLPVLTADNKKLLVRVLLEAAKAINDLGTALEMPHAAPTRVLAG